MRNRAGKARASNHDLAAWTATAWDRALPVSGIVVGELFPFPDTLRGAYPDGVADDLRVAVRSAGVVDVARDVAADRGIANVQSIQLEAPDVALFQVPHFPLQAFAVGDLLAVIRDDACVFGNWLCGEDAPTVDLGMTFFDQDFQVLRFRFSVCFRLSVDVQHATGPKTYNQT